MKTESLTIIFILLGYLLNGQTQQVLSATQPLVFTSLGTGTYDKSVIYNDDLYGFKIDLAKEEDDFYSDPIDFRIDARGGKNPFFTIKGATGFIGVNTATPDSRLTVKGNIHAEEIKVDLSVAAPDYVFKKDYNLIPLEEVQHHINEKGHLPNIPSAKELEENGVELGVMNMKLLEKIEELTLYVIHQNLEIKKMTQENIDQNKKIKQLKELITKKN